MSPMSHAPRNEDVQILSRECPFKKGPFTIEVAQLHFPLYGGEKMSKKVTRVDFQRGDAVAVLLYNPEKEVIILAEQFRYAAYKKGDNGWVQELPAGGINEGETPPEAAKREVEEEMGYRLRELEVITCFYPSPGGSSERIHVFYAEVENSDRVADGGGLELEHEDIRTIEYTRSMLTSENVMKFNDSKTLIALQWFLLTKAIK